MKTRITLYGENDIPMSVLGDNPTMVVETVWKVLVELISRDTEENVEVEKVEVWD